MGNKVAANHTVSTPDEMLEATGRAYIALFAAYPPREFCLCLMGQWAGETGAGKYEWNNNVANEQWGGPNSQYDWISLNAWEMKAGVRVPMQERFRAFPTLQDGVAEHLTFLHSGNGGRYATSFIAALDGNPEGFVLALHSAGYYTQSEAIYAHTVRQFFDHYAALPPAPWEQEMQSQVAAQEPGS